MAKGGKWSGEVTESSFALDAGKNLKPGRKKILNQAKIELRKLFDKS